MDVRYRMGVAVGRVLVTRGLVTAVHSRPGVHKPETQQTTQSYLIKAEKTDAVHLTYFCYC